jgi:hypothetical protein
MDSPKRSGYIGNIAKIYVESLKSKFSVDLTENMIFQADNLITLHLKLKILPRLKLAAL